MSGRALRPSTHTDDLRIVLLGKTGSGKSASGNTILGREVFKEDISSDSVTTECLKVTAEINGRQISVVDTPGLFDTTCPDEKIKDEITKCISLALPGPHVFLLVIAPGRFTEEQKKTVEMIQEMFGEESVKYTIVLFTRGDELKKTLNEYLKVPDPGIKDLLTQCGDRFHLFSNRDKSNTNQVGELLNKIAEMLKANEGSCYTDEMFQKAKERKLEKDKGNQTNDLRIVLLGKTGSGKSASGNTILGREVFKEDISSDSVTTECLKVTAEINGRQISVVDTPGLFDTTCPDEKIKDEITKCISLALPGPHVFLLVIAPGCCTEEQKKTVEMIQEMFDEESVKYTIVLFTRGDELKKTLDEYLKVPDPGIKDLLTQCGDRFHLFSNRDKSNTNQVGELLNKIAEMLEANEGSCYTDEMFRKAKERKLEKDKGNQTVTSQATDRTQPESQNIAPEALWNLLLQQYEQDRSKVLFVSFFIFFTFHVLWAGISVDIVVCIVCIAILTFLYHNIV